MNEWREVCVGTRRVCSSTTSAKMQIQFRDFNENFVKLLVKHYAGVLSRLKLPRSQNSKIKEMKENRPFMFMFWQFNLMVGRELSLQHLFLKKLETLYVELGVRYPFVCISGGDYGLVADCPGHD